MAYPENTYPTDPDLTAPSNQVTFDVNLWNVITSYITDITASLAGISDQAGNVNLPSGQYVSWVNVDNRILGKGGVSIDCDGLYYAEAANSTVNDVTTQDLSFSAWIKLDSGSSDIEGIIAKRSTVNGQGYFFGIDDTTFGGADGVLVLFISDGTDTYTLTGNTDLRDNSWHHVAGIIDRDNAANCKLYLDGSEDGTTNKSGTLANVDSLTNSSNMRLGSGSYASRIFDGQIADVKTYFWSGSIWTQAEILRQNENPYNTFVTISGTVTDGWRCDEKEGTSINGYFNDLTLTDAAAWSSEGPAVVMQSDNLYVVGDISLALLKVRDDIGPTGDSTSDTVTIGGNLTVSGDISAETISETKIEIEQIATPSNPANNNAYLWNDNGAGAHDVGDIMIALTFGEVTKTAKLVDFA